MKTVILFFLFSLVGPAAFLSCYSNSQYSDDPHILENQTFCVSIYSLEEDAAAFSGSQRLMSENEEKSWLAHACQENKVEPKHLPAMAFIRCVCFVNLCNYPRSNSEFELRGPYSR